ncbi:MAG: septum formation protein Maf [Candidatus Omnitrophica bacterium CG1_02_46_14]|nr:MAG: septum formation protein Maf [Candidatus Omnitrophica bacterium CG1_02_46_14]
MIYLASTSPRRKRILKEFKIGFKAIKPNYEEKNHPRLLPGTLVRKHALAKAVSCLLKVKEGTILGVDTLVFCKNKIIGKPLNAKDAFKILNFLQGSWHTVYTGVAILKVQDHKIIQRRVLVEKTKVRLKPLDRSAIELYFKKISPLDKAGAYAIQTKKANIISEVKGSLYNAIGLPVERLMNGNRFLGL